MRLAHALAAEASVPLARVMLLRHFKGKLDALERVGANLEEFTLTQPKGTQYDFLLPSRDPIEIVGVIANEQLIGVYRVTGIAEEGSNRTITSETFRALDGAMKYPERIVRRFCAHEVRSVYLGRRLTGWSNPRQGVARVGGKLFDSVIFK